MRILLDTHFLVWIVTRATRLGDFPWLESYKPWGISPVSLLELQYLAEVGRLEVRNPEFTESLLGDSQFLVDDVPLVNLVQRALDLSWTRDPFDRLLCAHSLARRVPLCTVDKLIGQHHTMLTKELG
jgi:PIN domain nuclease of toxin-antitoxin system